MNKTFYLQAMNIHQGGGRALLLPLLESIPLDFPVVALLDQRMTLPESLPANLSVRRVSPTMLSRWCAERWLKQVVCEHDTVLCVGNLPPMNALRGRVSVFVQNRFLIDQVSLRTFPIRTHLRLLMERHWLRRFAPHANDFIVQTPSMRTLLAANVGIAESTVLVWPFASIQSVHNCKFDHAKLVTPATTGWKFDFIFPASGDPHKNHRRLIEAWSILAKDGLFPSLCITLDTAKYPVLWSWIDAQTKRLGLNVTNLGLVPHEELLKQYHQTKALIYPSLLESFGLPLLEAVEAGLGVVAAELDYVRDIVNPAQTFDPLSPLSIARSAKRFLGNSDCELAVLEAKDFLKRVLALGMRTQKTRIQSSTAQRNVNN